jgi:hypothetical protein
MKMYFFVEDITLQFDIMHRFKRRKMGSHAKCMVLGTMNESHLCLLAKGGGRLHTIAQTLLIVLYIFRYKIYFTHSTSIFSFLFADEGYFHFSGENNLSVVGTTRVKPCLAASKQSFRCFFLGPIRACIASDRRIVTAEALWGDDNKKPKDCKDEPKARTSVTKQIRGGHRKWC